MFGLLVALSPLFAQQDGVGRSDAPALLAWASSSIFYFLILRPQQQQEQKRKAMIDAIKKNDKVVTTGGIYGTVISVDPADGPGGPAHRRREGRQGRVHPVERGAGDRGRRRRSRPNRVADRAGRRQVAAREASSGQSRVGSNRGSSDSGNQAAVGSSRGRPRESAGADTPGRRDEDEGFLLEIRVDRWLHAGRALSPCGRPRRSSSWGSTSRAGRSSSTRSTPRTCPRASTWTSWSRR